MSIFKNAHLPHYSFVHEIDMFKNMKLMNFDLRSSSMSMYCDETTDDGCECECERC